VEASGGALKRGTVYVTLGRGELQALIRAGRRDGTSTVALDVEWLGEQAALHGRMGPLPAIWSGNALLALVACGLIGRRRTPGEGVTIAS
jgi:hypothetical protein